MISFYETATSENFDVDAYLLANPDVADNADGDPEVARQHFELFGDSERRSQVSRAALGQIAELRARKLAAACPGLERRPFDLLGVPLEMATAPDPRLPVPYERISAHEYDGQAIALVESQPHGMILDLGSGMRPTYRHNVLYAEIAALPTTDVLCFAESLPFDDATFDGAICLSVLEHVADPFIGAAELLRVVRPGATVIVDWPFLQPVHGYPFHYFNATAQGSTLAFERLGAHVAASVPPWLHPVFVLRWLLDEWQTALPPKARAEFLDTTVGAVLAEESTELLERSWASTLPEGSRPTISAGTRLVVTKPAVES